MSRKLTDTLDVKRTVYAHKIVSTLSRQLQQGYENSELQHICCAIAFRKLLPGKAIVASVIRQFAWVYSMISIRWSWTDGGLTWLKI